MGAPPREQPDDDEHELVGDERDENRLFVRHRLGCDGIRPTREVIETVLRAYTRPAIIDTSRRLASPRRAPHMTGHGLNALRQASVLQDILDAARTLGAGAGPLVFTAGDGERLDEKVLRRLLERQGVAAVPHGFRSSFRDWAAEETEHRREVIEAALAHVVRNKVEAAYARSDLFARRRRLMDDWGAYLGEERGQVIRMRR